MMSHFLSCVRYFIKPNYNKKILGFKLRQTGMYSENTKRYVQLYTIKKRCLSSGIPFDISHEDIYWPIHCPILGVKLNRGGNRDNSPSLDRIIPELGYVKGNVRVISKLANGMKSNATEAQLEMFVKNIIPYMKNEI